MARFVEKSSYKWVITFASFFVMAVVTGVITNVFSIFTIPVTEDFNIKRQSFSLAQTLIFVANILVAPFVGSLIDKLGLIRIMKFFSIATPIIYFGYVLAAEINQIYFLSFMLGIAQCFLTQIPLSILLNMWFENYLGLAIGIAFMGSGVGGMIFNPLVNKIIEIYNWRTAFGFLGVVTMMVILPICFFVLKEPPSFNPRKTQDKKTISKPIFKHEISVSGFEMNTVQQSLIKDKRFLVLAVAFILYGIAGLGMVNFITPHFQDLGFSSYYSANVMAMSMGLMAFGKVILGIIYDRTNIRFATLFAMLASVVGLGGMYFAQYPWSIAALAFGTLFGIPAITISSPLIARSIFDPKYYAKANSLLITFKNIGLAFCPYIGGIIFDDYGSYRPLFGALIIIMVICFSLFFLVLPKRKRRVSI